MVFTHDAMGDGEDGPTHQPIEQLASLRAMPGMTLFRPGDANEVVEAYRYVLQQKHRPALMVLSRQPLPTLDRTRLAPAAGVAQGAYVLADPPQGEPEVILIASGSEVSLAVDAHDAARRTRHPLARGVDAVVGRVRDAAAGRIASSVLPPAITARVAIEQASTFGWARYVGDARHGDRHGDLRRLGAAEGAAGALRLHARSRGGGGEGVDRG